MTDRNKGSIWTEAKIRRAEVTWYRCEHNLSRDCVRRLRYVCNLLILFTINVLFWRWPKLEPQWERGLRGSYLFVFICFLRLQFTMNKSYEVSVALSTRSGFVCGPSVAAPAAFLQTFACSLATGGGAPLPYILMKRTPRNSPRSLHNNTAFTSGECALPLVKVLKRSSV